MTGKEDGKSSIFCQFKLNSFDFIVINTRHYHLFIINLLVMMDCKFKKINLFIIFVLLAQFIKIK